jgi:dTDP-4-dehydrorhamnose reductase
MILLLGGSGYIGSSFASALRLRGIPFAAPSRREADYTRFSTLHSLLKSTHAEFIINAAGYTGRPNVDACELDKASTLLGNTVFPVTVAAACESAGVPWAHVSSGCVYTGAKVLSGGLEKIEPDLTAPHLRPILRDASHRVHGWVESDPPNFSFRSPPCSFYSGSKALAEEALAQFENVFIWRLRIPFDEYDNDRNYLSKIQRYPKVYDNFNSLSHRRDFVNACLDLWSRRASFGIYNVTNPGYISTREVVALIENILKPQRRFEFWNSDDEFYRFAAKTPRSNCILDTSKLLAAGVQMRPVSEALDDALRRWNTGDSGGRNGAFPATSVVTHS